MRSNFFFFCRDAISRGGVADLARFPRLTLVDKWVGHQLASPADLPTIVTYMANGTYRLAISRKKILPTHSSTNCALQNYFWVARSFLSGSF